MSDFTLLHCPQGVFHLHRLPHDRSNTLRAWDSADELLLQTLHDNAHNGTPLLLNDSFGALSVALSSLAPVTTGDSWVSRLACQQNLQRNDLPDVAFVPSTKAPPSCSLLVMKQSKNLRFFEYQLQQLSASQLEATPIYIGGMQKYLNKSFLETASRYLDDFSVSRAVKKARVLSGRIKAGKKPAQATPRDLSEYGLRVYDTANVFSAGKIDIGSRFLLQHFPAIATSSCVIDLGCGNGLLGLHAMRAGAEVHFVDESWQALQASQLASSEISQGQAEFHLSHCLQQYAGPAADIILCNPPFHQQQAVSTQIAWQMFMDAKEHLQRDGRLYVVANRHLEYHKSLRKLYKCVELRASNNKFVVLEAS